MKRIGAERKPKFAVALVLGLFVLAYGTSLDVARISHHTALAVDDFTIKGAVTYANWDGNTSPAERFRIELWWGGGDNPNPAPEYSGRFTHTDVYPNGGKFEITATLPNPFPYPGVSLRFYSSGSPGSDEIQVLNATRQLHTFESKLYIYTAPGIWWIDDPNQTWNLILQYKSASLWAKDGLYRSYTRAHSTGFDGSDRIQSMTLVWPHPHGTAMDPDTGQLVPTVWAGGSWYKYTSGVSGVMPPGRPGEIYLNDEFDPMIPTHNKAFFYDSSIHESGHYVMHKLYLDTMPLSIVDYTNILRGLGGSHSPHRKSSAEFAWMEGWPEFWAAAVRGVSLGYEEKTYGNKSWAPGILADAYGQEVEGWVAAALWDLLDSGDESSAYVFDKYNFELKDIWNRVANGGTTQKNFSDFWVKWQADLPAYVQTAKRSIYQGTIAFPPPFIQPVFALNPVITSDGFAAVEMKLASAKDGADDVLMPDGLESFQLKVGPQFEGGYVAGVAKIPGTNVYAPNFVSQEADGSVIYSVNRLPDGADVQAPTGRSHVRIKLTGSVDSQYPLNFYLKNLVIKATGEDIGVAMPQTLTLRRGDANSNGSVTITDPLFIAQHLAGLRDLGFTTDKTNAINAASAKPDTSLGDKLDIVDALFIAQMLAGLKDGYFNDTDVFASKISIASGAVPVNQYILLPVEVRDLTLVNQKLSAYQLKIKYNQAVIQVVDVLPGDYPFDGLNTELINQGSGLVYIGHKTTEAVDGTIRLATLKVQGQAAGYSNLDVIDLGAGVAWPSKLVNSTGGDIPPQSILLLVGRVDVTP